MVATLLKGAKYFKIIQGTVYEKNKRIRVKDKKSS